MTQLTPSETALLRDKVIHGQYRKAGVKYVPVNLIGGPLGDLSPHIDASITKDMIDWTGRSHRGELLQVLYEKVADGWRYMGCEVVSGQSDPSTTIKDQVPD